MLMLRPARIYPAVDIANVTLPALAFVLLTPGVIIKNCSQDIKKERFFTPLFCTYPILPPRLLAKNCSISE